MKDLVHAFLKERWDGKSALLLGCSGGPDSLALLHILLEEKLPVKLALAHVDHGWRPASRHEAELLAELAAAKNLPFHLKTLCPLELKGNLEAACRAERLQFFALLAKEFGYQAVLLAHHADDQAETVLKKIFEGVSLTGLMGLTEASCHQGLHIWRPLLKVPKREIWQFLQARALQPFDDETNRDVRFLRARLREKLFPAVQKFFGKEIHGALGHLGQEALELNAYLQRQIAPYLSQIAEGPFGAMLDLSAACPQELVELRHLIRHFCKSYAFALSRSGLDNVVELLGCGNKQIESGERVLYIDRKRLFLPKNKAIQPLESFLLPEGSFSYGDWSGSLLPAEFSCSAKVSDWRALWRGEVAVSLPVGTYTLCFRTPNVVYPGGSDIAKWWSAQKVPNFLRHWMPLVWRVEEGGGESLPVHEFLTGRAHFSFLPKQKVLNLVLKRNM